MEIQKQGDTYQEETVTPEDAMNDINNANEEEDIQIDTIYGIPKRFVIIGVAVLFVLIALAAVFMVSSKKKKTEANSDEVMDQVLNEQPTGDVPVDQSTDEMLASMMDEMGAEGGVLEESTEESTGESTEGSEQDSESEDVSTEPPMTQINNVDLNVTELRSYGYTADEIDLASTLGVSQEQLISDAQAKQNQAAKEAMTVVSNTASPEYQRILNYTYLGQEEMAAPIYQADLENPRESYISKTINSDYVKCPLNGMQLFLKCKVFDGVYAWMSVTPSRWCVLPDAGNIIVTVQYAVYGDNTYIVDIREDSGQYRTVEGD